MQLKDFASITASMINRMKAGQDSVTDFEIGSVARSLLEAPAQEIEELYLQMFAGIREAVQVSVYNTFDFPLLTATGASGMIRVTISPISTATLIPAGTVFQHITTALQYISTADATIAALASYVDVPVGASTTGSTTNTGTTAAFAVIPAPLTLVSAISTAGMTGGTDGESNDARLARFGNYIASLQRSTSASLSYGASLVTVTDASGAVIERIASSSVVTAYLVDPLLYTPGLVWLYIDNGLGVASSTLITRCQQVIDGYIDTTTGTSYPGWKAAGVVVQVKAATRTTVDVTGAVHALPGYDKTALQAGAIDLIVTYLNQLTIGQTAQRADMIALVMGQTGIDNFILTLPAADVTAAPTVKLAPGTITITAP